MTSDKKKPEAIDDNDLKDVEGGAAFQKTAVDDRARLQNAAELRKMKMTEVDISNIKK